MFQLSFGLQCLYDKRVAIIDEFTEQLYENYSEDCYCFINFHDGCIIVCCRAFVEFTFTTEDGNLHGNLFSKKFLIVDDLQFLKDGSFNLYLVPKSGCVALVLQAIKISLTYV